MPADLLPGLCSVTFRQLEPARIVDLAVEAGLAAIEWGGDVHAPPGAAASAVKLGERTRAAGLAVSSYGSYVRPPADGLDAFDRTIEIAAALGAPMIRIWPGERGRPSHDYAPAERARAVEMIRAMAERAAAGGLAIGLEFHPDTLTDRLASAAALIGEIAHDAAHLYWQPRPGLPADEGRTELDALGPHIAHLHVFHWDARGARRPLAEGVATWRTYLAGLAPPCWSGRRYALLEFVLADDPERFLEDAACLTSKVLAPAG